MKILEQEAVVLEYPDRRDNRFRVCAFVAFVFHFAVLAAAATYCLMRVGQLEATVTAQDQTIVELVALYDLLQTHLDNPSRDYEEITDTPTYEYYDSAESVDETSGDLLSWQLNSSDEVMNRMRRDVLAETIDGVKINSESYATAKATSRRTPSLSAVTPASVPITQPGFHSPAWYVSEKYDAKLKLYEEMETTPSMVEQTTSGSLQSRKSRVMHIDDKTKAFKQIFKVPKTKSLERNRLQESHSSESSLYHRPLNRHRTRPRQRLVETLDEAELPAVRANKHISAAQFSGDTSKYVLGHHTNYNGNGHIKHPDRKYVDWVPSEWMKAAKADQRFHIQNGLVTIPETGLYFVYAQIYYLDEHDMNGYRVYKNSESILQCTTMTHSVSRVIKGNTCFTAGVEFLAEGDLLSIRDLSDERYSLFEKGKSFFGVMKLADATFK